MSTINHETPINWEAINRGRDASDVYGSDARTRYRIEFDIAVKDIKHRLTDAQLARTEVEAIREVMLAQARQIAQLQAENEQLTQVRIIHNAQNLEGAAQ